MAENITHVEVRLNLDLASIPVGSEARQNFTTLFVSDVSVALGVSSERVQIEQILAGSIIVVFAILPALDGTKINPIAVAMLDTPSLVLGGYQASGLRIITSAPPPPPVELEDHPSEDAITAVFFCIAGICGVMFCIFLLKECKNEFDPHKHAQHKHLWNQVVTHKLGKKEIRSSGTNEAHAGDMETVAPVDSVLPTTTDDNSNDDPGTVDAGETVIPRTALDNILKPELPSRP